MRLEKLKKKYSFTDENLKKIQEAVVAAEKNTDGEIALAITPSSSSYGFWELLFAVIMGLITFACLIPVSSKLKTFIDSIYWDMKDYHFSFWLLLIVFISILIFYGIGLNDSKDAEKDYEAIFKICMYIFYLIILFTTSSSNKYMKYILFGLFYFICIII